MNYFLTLYAFVDIGVYLNTNKSLGRKWLRKMRFHKTSFIL
jgi:hypothetical protein